MDRDALATCLATAAVALGLLAVCCEGLLRTAGAFAALACFVAAGIAAPRREP